MLELDARNETEQGYIYAYVTLTRVVQSMRGIKRWRVGASRATILVQYES